MLYEFIRVTLNIIVYLLAFLVYDFMYYTLFLHVLMPVRFQFLNPQQLDYIRFEVFTVV